MNLTSMEIIKASVADAGCWIDGHMGQYGPRELVEIAQSRGMLLDEEARRDVRWAWCSEVDDVTRNQCHEHVISQGGIADEAEEWLNEHVAPEGFSFGWYGGEFFLMDSAWWELA